MTLCFTLEPPGAPRVIGHAAESSSPRIHDEGSRALLELVEVQEVGSEEWDSKLEELVEAVTHHVENVRRIVRS